MSGWELPFSVGEIQRNGIGVEWTLIAGSAVSKEEIQNFVGSLLAEDEDYVAETIITGLEVMENYIKVRGRAEEEITNPRYLLDNAYAEDWLMFFQMSWANSYKYPDSGGTFAIERINDAVIASYFFREEWKDGGETYDWDVLLAQQPQKAFYLPASAVEHTHFYGVLKYGVGRVVGGVRIKPDGLYVEVRF